MPQPTSTSLTVDLTRIDNAEVRRALRQLLQQAQEQLNHQQIQIEALMELIAEKHVASVSEIRRAVQRVATHSERAGRIHAQITQAVREGSGNLLVNPREAESPDQDVETRQIYRL